MANEFIGPRGSGKTAKLIKAAAAEKAYIVCANTQHLHSIMSQARYLGVDINFPITMDEFINRRYYAKGIRSFMFDDIERCVQQLTTVSITGFTATVLDLETNGTEDYLTVGRQLRPDKT